MDLKGIYPMTSFFSQPNCDRCGAFLTSRIMSRFNTDCLCPECEAEERRHPDYAKAEAAEMVAVRRGDYFFPGIGWPGKDGRVS